MANEKTVSQNGSKDHVSTAFKAVPCNICKRWSNVDRGSSCKLLVCIYDIH